MLPIADRHHEYAGKVASALRDAGIRVTVDDRAEKLGFKIREAELQKVPFMIVVGDKEAEGGDVVLRRRGEQDTSEHTREQAIKEILAAAGNQSS